MNDIIIKGVQKASLLDYPEKICAVIFLTKCNFRCAYCYNPELIFDNNTESPIKKEEIIDFLLKKKKWIDAVCITGGEPTLHKGLKEFIKEIKRLNLLVKLDTNGTNPELIDELIRENLVDYIAMDIKSGKENYNKITKADLFDKVSRTIAIIRKYGDKENRDYKKNFDYEFRTTMHPDLFNKKELLEIINLITKSKRYALQQFKPDVATIGNISKKIYGNEAIKSFLEIAKPHFKECMVRGI